MAIKHVVCIDDKWSYKDPIDYPMPLKKGTVYTVIETIIGPGIYEFKYRTDLTLYVLREVKNPNFDNGAFAAARFVDLPSSRLDVFRVTEKEREYEDA